jgi:hypothetical protein
MLAEIDSLTTVVETWLTRFEQALGAQESKAVSALFHADSYWRDVLALTWDIRTVSGAGAIIPDIMSRAAQLGAHNFRIAEGRTPPREVARAGTSAIEAIITFETAQARCNGVVRLIPDGSSFKAWTLLTALDEIKDHEEHVGRTRRPLTRATSAGPTGSTSARRRRPTPIAIPTC